MARTPEEGHTAECLAAALIRAIEQLREIHVANWGLDRMTAQYYFRLAAQGNEFLSMADDELRDNPRKCTCPPYDTGAGDEVEQAWKQAAVDFYGVEG